MKNIQTIEELLDKDEIKNKILEDADKLELIQSVLYTLDIYISFYDHQYRDKLEYKVNNSNVNFIDVAKLNIIINKLTEFRNNILDNFVPSKISRIYYYDDTVYEKLLVKYNIADKEYSRFLNNDDDILKIFKRTSLKNTLNTKDAILDIDEYNWLQNKIIEYKDPAKDTIYTEMKYIRTKYIKTDYITYCAYSDDLINTLQSIIDSDIKNGFKTEYTKFSLYYKYKNLNDVLNSLYYNEAIAKLYKDK